MKTTLYQRTQTDLFNIITHTSTHATPLSPTWLKHIEKAITEYFDNTPDYDRIAAAEIITALEYLEQCASKARRTDFIKHPVRTLKQLIAEANSIKPEDKPALDFLKHLASLPDKHAAEQASTALLAVLAMDKAHHLPREKQDFITLEGEHFDLTITASPQRIKDHTPPTAIKAF